MIYDMIWYDKIWFILSMVGNNWYGKFTFSININHDQMIMHTLNETHIIQLFLLSCFLNNKCLWWYMCMGMKVANTVEKVQSTFHHQQVQKKNFLFSRMKLIRKHKFFQSTYYIVVHMYLWAQTGASPAQWRAGTTVAHRAGLELFPSNSNSYQGNQARTTTPYVIYLFQVLCHLNKKKEQAGLIIWKFWNLW